MGGGGEGHGQHVREAAVGDLHGAHGVDVAGEAVPGVGLGQGGLDVGAHGVGEDGFQQVFSGGEAAEEGGLAPDAVERPDVTVHPIMADPGGQTLTVLAEQAASGALRVPITATYPLEQAHQAFTAFGEGALGKIAVTCS
ncbi:zinc-binding dehydrogenase [Planomonospora venezuelensis]